MNAVATGARAHGDDRITDAFSLGANQFVFVQDPDAHGVNQRISFVGGVEHDVAAHGGNANAVAVVADSLDDAAHEVPDAWRIE